METAASEVGKRSLGFFCTGYFLLPFSSSIVSGDCYSTEEESNNYILSEIDYLNRLKNQNGRKKFASSRQNTLSNRYYLTNIRPKHI